MYKTIGSKKEITVRAQSGAYVWRFLAAPVGLALVGLATLEPAVEPLPKPETATRGLVRPPVEEPGVPGLEGGAAAPIPAGLCNQMAQQHLEPSKNVVKMCFYFLQTTLPRKLCTAS